MCPIPKKKKRPIRGENKRQRTGPNRRTGPNGVFFFFGGFFSLAGLVQFLRTWGLGGFNVNWTGIHIYLENVRAKERTYDLACKRPRSLSLRSPTLDVLHELLFYLLHTSVSYYFIYTLKFPNLIFYQTFKPFLSLSPKTEPRSKILSSLSQVSTSPSLSSPLLRLKMPLSSTQDAIKVRDATIIIVQRRHRCSNMALRHHHSVIVQIYCFPLSWSAYVYTYAYISLYLCVCVCRSPSLSVDLYSLYWFSVYLSFLIDY